MDHSERPISWIAAMNNSPQTDTIARMSNLIKDFRGSGVMAKSPR
jgi:hypothetical protein